MVPTWQYLLIMAAILYVLSKIIGRIFRASILAATGSPDSSWDVITKDAGMGWPHIRSFGLSLLLYFTYMPSAFPFAHNFASYAGLGLAYAVVISAGGILPAFLLIYRTKIGLFVNVLLLIAMSFNVSLFPAFPLIVIVTLIFGVIKFLNPSSKEITYFPSFNNIKTAFTGYGTTERGLSNCYDVESVSYEIEKRSRYVAEDSKITVTRWRWLDYFIRWLWSIPVYPLYLITCFKLERDVLSGKGSAKDAAEIAEAGRKLDLEEISELRKIKEIKLKNPQEAEQRIYNLEQKRLSHEAHHNRMFSSLTIYYPLHRRKMHLLGVMFNWWMVAPFSGNPNIMRIFISPDQKFYWFAILFMIYNLVGFFAGWSYLYAIALGA